MRSAILAGLDGFYCFDVAIATTLIEREMGKSRDKTLAKVRCLSEKDALDVFHHGDLVKHNMMIRKYNGYEIGIWFFKDKITGQAIITSIWKRGRK